MITLIMGIVLIGLGMYSIYITSPMMKRLEKEKELKTITENLDREIEKMDLISFRDAIVSKGKDWFLGNKETIRDILVRKYGKEQGWYNYLFLMKTFAFGIDKKIQEGEW